MNRYIAFVWALLIIKFTSAAQVNGAHLKAFLQCVEAIVKLDYHYIVTDSGELLVQPVDTSLVPEKTDDSDMMTCIVLFTRSFDVSIDNGMGVYHADKTPKPLNLAAYDDIYSSDLNAFESFNGLHNQEEMLTQQTRMFLTAFGYNESEIANILDYAAPGNSTALHHVDNVYTSTMSVQRWASALYNQVATFKSI